MTSTPFIIAIDGQAASGKGTLAKRLAAHFAFAHLDTGALYRAVGVTVLRRGEAPENVEAATAAARSLTPEDLDVLIQDPEIRSAEAGPAASKVSAIPSVRTALFDLQRNFVTHPPGGAAGAVLDGRDIGTVICPEAPAKLFVTASLEIRAERRVKELQNSGKTVNAATVLAEMRERDARDSGRDVAPMVPAPDAFLLDTTTLNADQAFATALAFVQSKMGLTP
jgi:CMP/dCMP kinase